MWPLLRCQLIAFLSSSRARWPPLGASAVWLGQQLQLQEIKLLLLRASAGICYFRWTQPTTKALQTLAHIRQAALEQQQTLRLQRGEGAKPWGWIWGSFLQPQSVAEVRSCPCARSWHRLAAVWRWQGDRGSPVSHVWAPGPSQQGRFGREQSTHPAHRAAIPSWLLFCCQAPLPCSSQRQGLIVGGRICMAGC